ncbi:hypothetical protein Q0M12_14225, partial [Staphylococcus aureus]|nr:hypothetical protein [Staphylococcus aureus]
RHQRQIHGATAKHRKNAGVQLDGLYVSGETPYRYQLAMGVPRDEKILVGILDKVLADLSSAETDAIQQHWVGSFTD